MWAVSNNIGAYYRFEPTRSGLVATEELLKDHEGSALTDGFAGYKRLGRQNGIRMGHCWSHVRREFFERKADFPKEVDEIGAMIDNLFAIERKAKTFEELSMLRRDESRPLVGKIYQWLLDTPPKHLTSSGLVGAIDYTLKLWPGLTLFLKDLSMPLTNNDVERAIRHVVMGRKNFGGSKTIDGADVAANLYTVIESAKRVGLQPKEYLKYLIDARWFGDAVKTPYEYSQEKFGPNKRVKFPAKDQWRFND